MPLSRSNHPPGRNCVTCPLCKADHPVIGDPRNASNIGRKIFVCAECPICQEQCSPQIALPCGHCFCEEDFQHLLDHEHQTQATTPTRRIIRAVRPPPNPGFIPSRGSVEGQAMPAAPLFADAPMPSQSMAFCISSAASNSPRLPFGQVNRQIPGSAVASSLASAPVATQPPAQGSHGHLPQTPSSPPFSPPTYVRTGVIPDASRQRRIEPKRRKLHHPPEFSNGADGVPMQTWTRKEKDGARNLDDRKRRRASSHMNRVWAPHISQS